MSENASREDPELAEIVRRLVASYQPLEVYLLLTKRYKLALSSFCLQGGESELP